MSYIRAFLQKSAAFLEFPRKQDCHGRAVKCTDPISEYNLNQSILHSAEDKTVLFISHRLSTTRHADMIYMFEKGRIIESGSHEKLMDKNGKYAYMFRLQAEKYCVDSMTE